MGGLEIFTVNLAKKLQEFKNDARILTFKPVGEEMNLIATAENKIEIFSAGRISKADFSFLAEAQKYMKDFSPDIIVSLSGLTYFFIELLQKISGRSTPHIIAFHSLKPYDFKEKIFGWLFLFFSKLWKSYYLFVSDKQFALNAKYYNLSKKKSFVIHNAVDTDFFFRSTPSEGKKYLNIIHIANIVAEKDQWTMLKALEILNRNFSDWKLVFVGKDKINLLAEFKNYLKKANLSDKVNFAQCTERTELKKLLSDSDIFVLTSVAEALPVSAIEAMSMGLPCILTEVGGCPEIVTDGYNGYLAKPRDPRAVADKISFLSENRSLLKEMGSNARKTALEKFNLNVCAAKYMKMFNTIAKTPDKIQ